MYDISNSQRDSSYSNSLPVGNEQEDISNKENDNHRPPMATVGKGGKAMFYPAPDPTEHFFPQYNQCQQAWNEARITTSSNRDETASTASVGNVSDNTTNDATEWIEQDEPGVYVTIRQLADGTRDLRRVRFRHVIHSFIHLGFSFYLLPN